ncbi:MAG TPA: CAP domain-containing protein [Ktedonobacterales bacterium]|nr:CAP domain-containing protein [Ktedonobacterales bacterium]
MSKRRMMPGLLIGALLLAGGGCWIGVAASFAARWTSPAFSAGNMPYGVSAGTTITFANTATATAIATNFATRVIARTNSYRVARGCPALATNSILMGTAQAHSADMATHDFVGHNSSSGTTISARIKAAGYAYSTFAENIAWGQTSPEQVVDMWFNESPPNDAHRKNILNCALHDIGVGYVYLASDPGKVTSHTYWTEDFGTRATG